MKLKKVAVAVLFASICVRGARADWWDTAKEEVSSVANKAKDIGEAGYYGAKDVATSAASKAQELGSAGLEKTKELGQKALDVGKVGLDKTKEFGQKALDVGKAGLEKTQELAEKAGKALTPGCDTKSIACHAKCPFMGSLYLKQKCSEACNTDYAACKRELKK